jgi:hypothetical protein
MTTRFVIIDRHPVSHTLLLVSFQELFQNPAIPLFFATLFCKSALEPLLNVRACSVRRSLRG